MHPGALGARNQRAMERMIEAAKRLAARFGCHAEAGALATVQAHDADVRAMFQRERIADLLEALEKATAQGLSDGGKAAGQPETARPRGRPKAG